MRPWPSTDLRTARERLGRRDRHDLGAEPPRERAGENWLRGLLPGWRLLVGILVIVLLVRIGPSPWHAATIGSEDIDALLDAAGSGDVDGVRRALDQGVSPDATRFCLSPLLVASNPEVARLLIGRGAHLDRVAGDGTTPVCAAIFHRRLDVLGVLLNAGADANAHPAARPSPLETARAMENPAAIELLLEHGARDEASPERGK